MSYTVTSLHYMHNCPTISKINAVTHGCCGEVERVSGSYPHPSGMPPNVTSNHEPKPWRVPEGRGTNMMWMIINSTAFSHPKTQCICDFIYTHLLTSFQLSLLGNAKLKTRAWMLQIELYYKVRELFMQTKKCQKWPMQHKRKAFYSQAERQPAGDTRPPEISGDGNFVQCYCFIRISYSF